MPAAGHAITRNDFTLAVGEMLDLTEFIHEDMPYLDFINMGQTCLGLDGYIVTAIQAGKEDYYTHSTLVAYYGGELYDNVNIRVIDPPALTLDEPMTVEHTDYWHPRRFTFTPTVSGYYSLYYDVDGASPGITGKNEGTVNVTRNGYYTKAELTAGETYTLTVGSNQSGRDGRLVMSVAGESAASSSIRLRPIETSQKQYTDDDGIAFYRNREIGFQLVFDGEPEEFTATLSDPTMGQVFPYPGNEGVWQIFVLGRRAGDASLTVTTKNGLTAQVALRLLAWMPEDLSHDNRVDAEDVYIIQKALLDGNPTPDMELTGDNQIDRQDRDAIAALVDDPPVFIAGKLDDEDTVTITDALILLQILVEKITPTPYQELVGDVDANGELAVSDALMILQFITDKVKHFPLQDLL